MQAKKLHTQRLWFSQRKREGSFSDGQFSLVITLVCFITPAKAPSAIVVCENILLFSLFSILACHFVSCFFSNLSAFLVHATPRKWLDWTPWKGNTSSVAPPPLPYGLGLMDTGKVLSEGSPFSNETIILAIPAVPVSSPLTEWSQGGWRHQSSLISRHCNGSVVT